MKPVSMVNLRAVVANLSKMKSIMYRRSASAAKSAVVWLAASTWRVPSFTTNSVSARFG
jgi:hypothetical protein